MTVAGTIDAPLDIFGGLVTDLAAPDLPLGVSPDCADVAFLPGAVKTRPGLQPVFAALAGNPTVNYLKTYITLNLTQRLLALDSAGNFWKESSPGALAQVASGLAANAYGKSTTTFGREYLALSDGKFGLDVPRQFDDINFDRVSQVGPGGAPSAAEEASTTATLAAAPNGAARASVVATISAANGAVRTSNVVTITATAAHTFGVGYSVTIAGVGDASFNGAFTIVSVPSATTFTYAQTAPNGASSGGTATANVVTITTTAAHSFQAGWTVSITGVTDASFNGVFAIGTVPATTTFTFTQSGAAATSGGGAAVANPIGNIAAGTHQVVVMFQTRQGYITRPSPPVAWTATGGRRVAVTNIPTGPSNVIARILAFTAAGGADFYYVGAGATLPSGNMIIADNASTSLTVDFSDATLLAGTWASAATPGKSFLRLVELGECQGVIDYAQRLFWWGERNKANNWLNLTFDGGWSGNVPLGWQAGSQQAGGTRETSLAVWGEAYRITGDGATGVRGTLTQQAYKDQYGVPLIAPGADYSVRARVMQGGGLAQGTLRINLSSVIGGFVTAGLAVTAAQAGTTYAEFTAQLIAPISSVPADIVLQLYVDGIPTSGGYFVVDNIEIFPTNQPYNASLVRASRVEDAESYDGVNGILLVSENNGQAIRCAFRLRERLYFVKEHSLYVTEDDGVNEPALWRIAEVSRTVGTPSASGVDIGEDWAVIAHRSGLYIFWGAEPVKISQEIQPTWDAINWQYGHTIWVRVDTSNKRILCGVPIAPATSPNRVLVLDYRGLSSAAEIAEMGSIHYSAFSGKLFATGKARKWAPWFITANSAALAERSDGTAQMFLGNGAATGKIYQLSDAQFGDDGAAINSYYTTHFFLHPELEQALQVRSHRKLFPYLTLYAEGAGQLNLSAYADNLGFPTTLVSLALSNPGPKDLELPVNMSGERVAFRIGTNAATSWFKLQKFTPALLPDPWAPVRGAN